MNDKDLITCRDGCLNCWLFVCEMLKDKGIDPYSSSNEKAMKYLTEQITQNISNFKGEKIDDTTIYAVKNIIHSIIERCECEELFCKF